MASAESKNWREMFNVGRTSQKKEKLIRQNCRDIDLVRPNKTDPHRCISPDNYKMLAGSDGC